MINMSEVVKCGPYLFGDNPTILQQIVAKGDTLQLQSHINSLEDWSQKSLLISHPNECHVLTLGKCYNITHTESYTLHRQKLEDFFEQKDLDENISVKLKKQRNGWPDSKYPDGSYLKKLFSTFIRSHLEFGQVIWALYLKK